MKGTWNTLVAKCGTFCDILQLEGLYFCWWKPLLSRNFQLTLHHNNKQEGVKMFTTVQSTRWKVDMLKFKFSPGLIFFQNSLFQIMIMNIRQRKIKIELV